MTHGEALAEARAVLDRSGAATAALDARLLLADAAGLAMAELIARSAEPLPDLVYATFNDHLKRRRRGEPVARILDRAEFWGLSLGLNGATLVPRPETETLVEIVLDEAARLSPDIAICDLGTGSGAIAVALLSELPQARLVATDVVEDALAMAIANAERHGVRARMEVFLTDFSDGPEGPFDIVVSNPPYIQSAAIDTLPREVRSYDPRQALDGGADGLACIRAILARSGTLLAAGGLLALEVGHDQGGTVAALARDAGLSAVTVHKDLAGLGRVVSGRKGSV